MAELNLNTTVYQLTLTQSGDVVNLTLSSTSVTLELVTGGISEAYLAQKLTKENVSGLKITDSPEFASLQSTALQPETDGGQIPDADYSWFKGLFTSLQDKLIFSWIYGLISLVKDALTRIGLLEDKYILKYVVPADCSEIELTADKYGNPFNFVEGDKVEIIIQVKEYSPNNRINIRINNNSNSIYKVGGSETTYIYTAGTSYTSQFSSIIVNLINNEVQGTILNHSKTDTGTFLSQFYNFHTEGLDLSLINGLNLYRNASANIPGGAIIIIKKL